MLLVVAAAAISFHAHTTPMPTRTAAIRPHISIIAAESEPPPNEEPPDTTLAPDLLPTAPVAKAAKRSSSSPLYVETAATVSSFFTLRVAAVVAAFITAFIGLFSWLEKWPLLESAYYVCSCAATIGFGDVRPLSPAGKALTCVLACFGVGLLGNLVSATLSEWTTNAKKVNLPTTPWLRAWARLGLWPKAAVQFLVLMLVGVLGVRACEMPGQRPSWGTCAYLISGTLTTAGLGDVVPLSRRAKGFVAIYSVLGTLAFARVVGQLALRPLEAERKAAQQQVLDSYGSTLTEQSLADLSRGPLVKRLGLSQSDDFCTRDEYTLLLLVQQGKVSEEDLKEVRQAFDKLDVDKSGKLWRGDLELLQRPPGEVW